MRRHKSSRKSFHLCRDVGGRGYQSDTSRRARAPGKSLRRRWTIAHYQGDPSQLLRSLLGHSELILFSRIYILRSAERRVYLGNFLTLIHRDMSV